MNTHKDNGEVKWLNVLKKHQFGYGIMIECPDCGKKIRCKIPKIEALKYMGNEDHFYWKGCAATFDWNTGKWVRHKEMIPFVKAVLEYKKRRMAWYENLIQIRNSNYVNL